MSPVVILDADLLSAFLKIGRLPLVREFYRVERLYAPPAVYREVAVTDLLLHILAFPWVTVESPSSTQMQALLSDSVFTVLGAGEQEAIALALDRPESVLLMNDNQARRLAARRGVNVVNIPAFLLACKLAGLLNRQAMSQLVAALQEKDHYGFRRDVLDMLMS